MGTLPNPQPTQPQLYNKPITRDMVINCTRLATAIHSLSAFERIKSRNMARQLLLKMQQAQGTHMSIPEAGLVVASLLLCVFALFMCASHTRKLRRSWRACHSFVDEIFDDGPVIQHYDQNRTYEFEQCAEGGRGEEEERQELSTVSCEQPVWRKNILMGGKCQLPDFSGVIIYDSDGKLVSNGKPSLPLLTWK